VPVSFARLRVVGFKSFADPVLIDIRSGLTGIVGPNGCGKSNVVEALRWAMGENSARSLRGGDMDDVIFAGTALRPSRNIAEVTVLLEDTAGRVPPPFHEQPQLEISRKIERGIGSAYRVNGREVRARDVQTLFADLASGARASAMVSQGKIGSIVTAPPAERRGILEEAAGITGLYARRHEAELKLRAAEANLARAEDLRGQLEQQLAGLKRQARQANRYRNLSGAIREAEAEFLGVQRSRAEAVLAAARAALAEARQAVEAATLAATEAGTRATEVAAGLPPLRSAEAAARTALERHRVALEQIAAEERSARAALEAAEQRFAQVARDLGHATQLVADAEAAAARLAEEAERLAAEAAAHPARAEAAAAHAEQALEAMRAAETVAHDATERAADLAARHQALAQALAEAEARERRTRDHLARLRQERDAVRPVAAEDLCAAEAGQQQAEAAASAARAARDAAEQARSAASACHAAAAAEAEQAAAARARLAAEADALADVLRAHDGASRPRAEEALTVPPGLETALGAALGEELQSALDPAAPRHWRDLGELQASPILPEPATPLAVLVQAPSPLRRALAQIGLVEDDQGEAAQLRLAPGQMLVSRVGAIWRWDGHTVRPEAPTSAAVRLQQRNRLADLRPRLAEAEAAAGLAAAARHETAAAEQAAIAAERDARTALREAEQRFEHARAAAARLAAEAASAAAKLTALDDQLRRIEADHAEAEAVRARTEATRAALGDPAAARAEVARARAVLAEARQAEAAAASACDALLRAEAARSERERAIAAEQRDWSERARDAAVRAADLTARRDAAAAELAQLAEAPARISERRSAAITACEAAEAMHRTAADALAHAEQAAAASDRAARAAEAALAAEREALARAEATAQHAAESRAAIDARIQERLGPGAAVPEIAAADAAADWVEREERARKRFERLTAEREQMGPVNLRAELEAREIEQQIAAITTERGELETAIAKLRGSIGHLNREGRERLTAVFEQVDRHFQALYARMFGGGRAHLALVGSDDPLEAGLEIYAQPPGKKLSALSLLSGGEQALTALALIFAVFRCNPAPVCVLDEVDAPLDDANVERFCALLEEIARGTGARFLVITHHPLTMARMDQLYGVTMQERGISRVLSVDLRRAAELAEPPRMAAE
jgi:chromosome segregation protein